MFRVGQLYVIRDFTGDIFIGGYVRHDEDEVVFDQIVWVEDFGRVSLTMASGPQENTRCEEYPTQLEMCFPRGAIRVCTWPHARPKTQ